MKAEDVASYVMEQYPGGIYILDRKQRYIYANAAYLERLELSSEELLLHDVHELMEKGYYDICISDIVFKQKREVSVFSNVYANMRGILKRKAQLVRAIPIFDENQEIIFMLAFCDGLEYLNDCYYEANSRKLVAQENTFYSWSEVPQTHEKVRFVAESPAMQRVLKDAEKIACADSSVLITGASGTGKELVAEYIHAHSARGKNCMVVVNCAALPASLLESSLYGYEKGAFTGALSGGKKGLIEAADGGTLFLDEINSFPLELQGKLLRTLETKKVQRVGATDEKDVDFRLLTATNQDLFTMVRNGQFREDLYYRLNIIPLRLPALAERKEDVLPLVRTFITHYGEKYHKEVVLSEKAMMALTAYEWPGNVRELRNVIERIVVMIGGEYVTAKDIERILGTTEDYNADTSGELRLGQPFQGGKNRPEEGLREVMERTEWEYIRKALDACDGNVNAAAERLKIHRSVLYRKMKKYQQ